jgi:hypothetical protein
MDMKMQSWYEKQKSGRLTCEQQMHKLVRVSRCQAPVAQHMDELQDELQLALHAFVMLIDSCQLRQQDNQVGQKLLCQLCLHLLHLQWKAGCIGTADM